VTLLINHIAWTWIVQLVEIFYDEEDVCKNLNRRRIQQPGCHLEFCLGRISAPDQDTFTKFGGYIENGVLQGV